MTPSTSTPETQILFDGGQEGYHTYRIPALLQAANGDLLAFCEGRRDSPSDSGQIDLLLKRSADGGRTWSDQEVIVTEPELTCGNPCPVLDRDTGIIWLPFCKNLAAGGQEKITAARAPRTVWLTHSADHGRTWATPVEITAQVKKTCWTWYATGPGQGLQLASGRLIIPCDHNTGIRFDGSDPYGSHLIYSDDHGATWRIGAILSLPGNECYALELDDGDVYLNCRTRKDLGVRSYGYSRDGGLSFIEEGFHHELVEPRRFRGGCQGSLLKLPAPGGEGSLLLFCNPATAQEERQRLAIHVSADQGRTWKEARVICPGPSAYSDLALTKDGLIACLYEAGDQRYNERLVLARFSAQWLLGGLL